MIATFTTAASTLTAQPSSAGLFFIRSSNAADTANLVLVGNVTGTPTAETIALTGKREKSSTNTFQTIISAVLASTQAGNVTIRLSGTKGEGRIIVNTNPANNDTLIFGLIGFTTTYTFKTVLTGAANEILIGATAADTATNIRRCLRDGDAVIGDGTGEGTLYGTGTTANTYGTVSAISSTILTLQDRIACLRQLSWSLSQGTGATLGLQAPLNGVDGTLLATISAGGVAVYGAMSLDDEALDNLSLPPGTNWTSDWIDLDGKGCTIYLACSDVTTAIAAKYQTSTDTAKAIVRDGTVAITSLDNVLATAPRVVIPTERAKYLRLNLNNTNAAAASVNAKVVAA